jgi:hypothetical protein
VLGIELTGLFQKPAPGQSPLREQESLREQITTMAKAQYDAMGAPPLHVSVHFADHPPVRKSDVRLLADKVVNLALRHTPPVGGRSHEEYDWVNREYFPEQISAVMVFRPEARRESFWSTPSAGYLPKLSSVDVQAEIDGKDPRVSDYRRQCDRVWLVLCSHGEGLSSYVELAEEAYAHAYSTQFDRMLHYRWSKTVHELLIAGR